MQKLIVIAEEQERELAERYFPKMPILVTGVGALNVIKSLKDLPRDTEIFNIGYAGSANFAVGTIVEVTEVRLNHPNVQYDEPKYMLESLPASIVNETDMQKAICYTGVDFVLQSDYKDCVFDMELAFICGIGFERIHAIKYVSDNLSLHQYRETGGGV